MAEPSARPRDLEQEVEVVPAIRHEDAEWKIIQQNTFTRWVNNHLKKASQSINNLETDFADGLRLIALAEALSHKSVGRHNKKVSFRSQRLENVSLALSFFQDKEGIKIINIDSTHIVDQNKKLILGLIWTLILHYSISMGWTGDTKDGQPEETPKQKLLNWIRGRLPHGMPLSNFTSDWNDGLALGALVNTIIPGSVPNWDTWLPENALANTQKAMQAAKDRLGVEPLIDPEELIHPEIDEMSVMTYLSQFPTARALNSTEPLPSSHQNGQEVVVPSVYGEIQDLEEHPLIKKSSHFTVLCSPAFNPSVVITHESGAVVPVKLSEKEPGVYSGDFTPEYVGPHTARLRLENSNHGVIEPRDELYRFTAFPPARLCPYKDHATVGEPVDFRVEDAYNGPVDMIVVDGDGKESRIPVNEVHPGVHACSFTPKTAGLHSVNVFHRKNHLDSSPFPLRVRNNIPDCTVWGRGIADRGIRVGEVVPVHIKMHESLLSADPDLFNVLVKSKETGNSVPTKSFISHADNTLTFSYAPTDLGAHEVQVLYDNHPIEKAYNVFVTPPSKSKVRAFGPGLEGGVAEKESVFQVDSNGEPGALSFSIEGPSKAEITCQEKGNGAALVSYTPKLPGVYKVKVLSGGEHIPESPFILDVQSAEPTFHPAAARVTGLDGPHVAQQKVAFNLDTKRTNVNDAPHVSVYDKDHNSVAHSLNEVTPCLYAVDFLPMRPGPYTVDCRLRGVALPGAPYTVDVKDPVDISKLRMYGPGVDGPVVAQEPTHFTIDAKQAGPGAVEVALLDRQGQNVDIDVLDHQDGSFTVKYTAPKPGAYQLNVVFAGEEMSPIEINVQPRVDVSGISVSGLENSIITVHCEKEMHVFTADGENTRIVITSPSGRVVEAIIEETPTGLRVRFTPSEIGDYRLSVAYQDISIGSPYTLHSVSSDQDFPPSTSRTCAEAEYLVSRSGPAQPDKVLVSGPGLGPVVAQTSTYVIIDTSTAGFGDIDLFVDGPTRTPVHCVDNQDGTLTMRYTPKSAGLYWLRVMFNQQHIPGSPFQIVAVGASLLPSPRILPDMEKTDSPFTSLSKPYYPGQKVKIAVNAVHLKPKEGGARIKIKDNEDTFDLPVLEKDKGVYEAVYVPTHPGTVVAEVTFDNEFVARAPIHVMAGCDPKKVTAHWKPLSDLRVGAPAKFEIDTSDAGEGELSVSIEGPAECPCVISDNGDGTCTAKFIPKVPGKYEIGVKYGEDKTHVPNSPFVCQVDHPFNPESVYVSGLSHEIPSGEPLEFEVNTENTKDLPVSCIVSRGQQEPTAEKYGRIHKIRFVPRGESGESLPVQILYGGMPIKGSPFALKIARSTFPENVRILPSDSDPANLHPAGQETTVVVDTRACGKTKLLGVDVIGPDGRTRDCEVHPGPSEGLHRVVFVPDQSGPYKVNLFVDGVASNVDVTVNVVKIEADHPETSPALNSASTLTFKRPQTGEEITAKSLDPDAADIAIVSRPDGGGFTSETVEITPKKAGPNTIVFSCGGKEFHRFSYECHPEAPRVSEPAEAYEHDYSPHLTNNNYQPVYSSREFKFETDTSLDPDQLTAVVTMPSNKMTDTAEIIDNHDGSILVKYTPKTSGQHELSIFQEGKQVQGTPVKFFVDSYGDGYATVYGPGLQLGTVGEPAAFTVCAKGSHAKELSVSIEGPAQSTIKIHDNKDGTCAVTWVPPVPGEYKVHVKLGNKEVRNSPFSVVVAGEGQKRSHLSVGSTSEVALNITQTELKGISASIKSPSGIEEPCFVRLIEGGRLGVSFTPREAGEHLITVKRDGKLLPKAPFKIKVGREQVGDASKVDVSGDGKSRAICMQDNEILVDTSRAGFGGLSVSVQGPSKAELRCKEVKAGLIKVIYRPTEPGVYVIAIKFADHHVKDSPLTVNCTGKGAGRVLQEISRHAEQASVCLPDHEGNIYLKLNNTSPMDITSRIMDPKGKTEDVEMRDVGDQFYLIRFKPHIEGIHQLSVMHKDNHVNGSPLPFTVGSFGEGGAHKVRASGTGVIRGETNTVNTFNIYTREAGAGNLTVAIEGPAKAAVQFQDHKDGNCHVDYKVSVAGEYTVAVKFNDQHIPDSPFKVFIAAATGEARKLELAQFHDNVPTGKAYTFTVLTHRAKGHLEAKVMGPSNDFETIDIVPIEEGESYALRFIPKESGNHYIHVTLDGAPMRDSPFRLRVGNKDLSDPTAITASGEGLIRGETGHKSEFIISTVNAGAGVLTCQVDGPSKVTLDAYELDLGYKVRFTPMAPGDYFAAVKYNGIHIPGSPFKIPIGGKVLGGNGYNETSFVKIDANAKTSKGTVATVPEYKGEASKVAAKGAGLNKFFPGRPAVFTIDTGLAGTNLLMVGVVTTKGPCEEVIVKHQGQGHYVVNYKIHERVKGFIIIKYGDQEIPGSPFAIEP